MPEPAAGHAPGLVDAPDDMDELLGADPAALMNEPPQGAKDFEGLVEGFEMGRLAGLGDMKGADNEDHRVDRHRIEALADGEAMALRDVSGAVEGPACELAQEGVEGRG
jgi:hypothetical protein